MEAMLKVTPEKLLETAQEFANTEANIRNLSQEMCGIVNGFKSIWQGEAAMGFSARFDDLTADMERLFALIRKHSEDLTEMANEYRQAEEESTNLAATLSTEALI